MLLTAPARPCAAGSSWTLCSSSVGTAASTSADQPAVRAVAATVATGSWRSAASAAATWHFWRPTVPPPPSPRGMCRLSRPCFRTTPPNTPRASSSNPAPRSPPNACAEACPPSCGSVAVTCWPGSWKPSRRPNASSAP